MASQIRDASIIYVYTFTKFHDIVLCTVVLVHEYGNQSINQSNMSLIKGCQTTTEQQRKGIIHKTSWESIAQTHGLG